MTNLQCRDELQPLEVERRGLPAGTRRKRHPAALYQRDGLQPTLSVNPGHS